MLKFNFLTSGLSRCRISASLNLSFVFFFSSSLSFFFNPISSSLSLQPELSTCSWRNRLNLITDLFYSRRQGAIKGEAARKRDSAQHQLDLY